MKNEDEINIELENIEKENDNEFCSKDKNKENNKKEAKNQIDKITDKNCVAFIKTNSYVKLNGKLTISLGKTEKKELVDKYWIIKPEKKYTFYGKEIKYLNNNENISSLKDLIGILMVYKNFISITDFKRFDKYFSILIKSNERNYIKNEKEANKEVENIGKILYIGGNLKDNLGNMFEKEFIGDDKILPIYICIMIYREYEEIEIDALDYCDKIPEHNGFADFKNVFHQNFSKTLSNKIKRIKENRNKKRQKLIEEKKEE